MNEWQPIATAPNGVPILVTDGKVITVLMRTQINHSGKIFDNLVGAGFSGYEWDWDFEWDDLTHWMPVPELP